MMLVKSITIWMVVIIAGSVAVDAATATAGCIEGTIVDAKTGEPLPGASIIIEGTNRGTGTNNKGEFRISQLPHGVYRLLITSLGFETNIREVQLEPNGSVSLDLKLRENPLEIDGVVVTGTRTPRFIAEVPVRTEVITRKAIEVKSAANLYEALDGVPGIRVEQQCQACNFSVLRMQGLGADHTQVLLDGQPVYSGLASVYGLQQLSTADIEQIEVVKGAGSALYGSSAVAGAINIISSVPYRTEGTASIEFGEHGTHTYEVSAGARQDQYGLFLFAQQSQGDAIDETRDGMTPDEVRGPDGISDRVRTNRKNAGFNLYVNDVYHTDQLTVRGRYTNELRQGGVIENAVFENPFTAGTERIITDRYSAGIRYVKYYNAGNELSLEISYTLHKRNATNDTFLGDYEEVHGVLPSIDLLRPYLAEEDLYVATANYNHPLGKGRHRILMGCQYSYNGLEESGKYVDRTTGEPYTSFSDKHANEFGGYIQDEFQASDRIEIVAGLRLDHHHSEDNFRGSGNVYAEGVDPVTYNELSLNPRFAVKYDVADGLTIRSSIGTGFRVPDGFSEDLHLCSGSPRVWKRADLEPEKSLSYGLTVDYSAPRFGIGINLYRTELKNRVDFAELDTESEVRRRGYDYVWQNIGDASVTGAEIGVQMALTTDLALAADLAYNLGEYDNPRDDWVNTPYYDISNKFSHYPVTAAGWRIEYSPQDWSLTVCGEYKGRMYIDYHAEEFAGPDPSKIKKTEPFVLLHARMSKKLFDRFKIDLGAKNLTDYIQQEKHTDDAAFMYAPVYGRLFYAGVEVSLR